MDPASPEKSRPDEAMADVPGTIARPLLRWTFSSSQRSLLVFCTASSCKRTTFNSRCRGETLWRSCEKSAPRRSVEDRSACLATSRLKVIDGA
jgi:hypothetical protein